MNIIEAIQDPRFFRTSFKDLQSWRSWFVLLKALFGLRLESDGERQIFSASTGLASPPDRQAKEAYIIAGRRSGKSFMAAVISVFLATFKDWKPYLSPGEKGWIFIIATDRDQAKIIKRYIAGILDSTAVFRNMIVKESEWEIELKNDINISVKTCNFRSLRGFTVLAAICEEMAFWRDENSANPAQEVLAAIKPALATIPESMLIAISTPYARAGVLWEQFRTNYGNEDGIRPLIWKASTRIMNPTIAPDTIENAMREDPERARAEWEADWRADVEAFLGLDVLEAAIVPGRFELPKLADTSYVGFIDPSGGRQDSFTLAICHKDASGKIILDCVRETRPPFKPQNVAAEFSEVLHSYGVSFIASDRYSGEWVVNEFRKNEIEIESSELTSSEIYLSFLPLLMNGSVELLENRRLVDQLRGLERRVRAGGKDLISHGSFSGAHDDVAVAVAGAVVRCKKSEDFNPELFLEIMRLQPALSNQEKFKMYVQNWLLDRPQKKWTPEDDACDYSDVFFLE
jgi:hypothetical protein